MSVFDDLIKIDKDGNFSYAGWIEWNHFLVPNKPPKLRQIMRNLMALFGHCKKCTSLDGCYLQDNNRPELPLHLNCDCNRLNISFNKLMTNTNANFPVEKLTKYLFSNKEQSKGKINIFESWGYTIDDVDLLKNELKSQAKENYTNGNYRLKKLDEFGQRLAIPINLLGHDFYSGWILEPEGKIRKTTPFGGWIK